jgi:hypothetical protein
MKRTILSIGEVLLQLFVWGSSSSHSMMANVRRVSLSDQKLSRKSITKQMAVLKGTKLKYTTTQCCYIC